MGSPTSRIDGQAPGRPPHSDAARPRFNLPAALTLASDKKRAQPINPLCRLCNVLLDIRV